MIEEIQQLKKSIALYIRDEEVNIYDGVRVRNPVQDDLEKKGFTVYQNGGMTFIKTQQERLFFMKSCMWHEGKIAFNICKSKEVTKEVLKRQNISVAEGKVFTVKEEAEAMAYALSLSSAVIKPSRGKQSKGATIGVTSEKLFRTAWKEAVKESHKNRPIIVEEEFTEGQIGRYFVLNGKCISVTSYLGPFVIGDGEKTIEQLIDGVNEIRNLNPHLMRKIITINERREKILKEQGYDLKSIPKNEEIVVIDTDPNSRTGGVSFDLTDKVHPDYKAIAEKACRAVPGLLAAGVDLFAKSQFEKPRPEDYIILEINTLPATKGHEFPMYGRSQDISGIVVDYNLERFKKEQQQRKEKSSLGAEIIAPIKKMVANGSKENEYTEEPLSGEELLKKIFTDNGWKAEQIERYLYLSKDGRELAFNDSMSPWFPYLNGVKFSDPHNIKKLLDRDGLSVSKYRKVRAEIGTNHDKVYHKVKESLTRPVIMGRTEKIPLNPESKELFLKDWYEVVERYKSKSKNRRDVLIEEDFHNGRHRLKFLVIDRQVAAVVSYLSPVITGDGKAKIRELIKSENKRIKEHQILRRTIELKHVHPQGIINNQMELNQVLEKNHKLELINQTPDLEYYGITEEVKDRVHPSYLDLAVKAANIFYGNDILTVTMDLGDFTEEAAPENYRVAGMKIKPDLAEFRYPIYGPKREVEKDILKYVENKKEEE